MGKEKKKIKKPELVEVKTKVKYLPISSRKLGLIVKAIKKLEPGEALRQLRFLNKKGARFLIKAIRTALADGENNFGLARESLQFKEILVDQGPALKRRDKSHGARFNGGLIRKSRSHLTIKLVGQKKEKHGAKS